MSLKISDKLYDVLKWVAMYLLPALGTLYFALSGIWGLPYGEQIVGTFTAVDTFLAVILGLSKSGYEPDGIIHVDSSEEAKDVMKLEFNTEDPIAMTKDKEFLRFRVNWDEGINS